MQELSGKVAVVTGAASGIGLALARRFSNEGMRVALLDVEEPALADAAKTFGPDVLTVTVDVADPQAMDEAAARVHSQFGSAQVLCNNAGVAGGDGPLWTTTVADWAWVVGVNLLGVVNGIRAFVPAMVDSSEPGHVVNTASLAGLLPSPGIGPYGATKHGVVALSEQLALELEQATGGRVAVTVLCPSWVKTRILESQRNRPPGLRDPDRELSPELLAMAARLLHERGIEPDALAEEAVQAIKARRFCVWPEREWGAAVTALQARLLDGTYPQLEELVDRFPEEYRVPQG